MIKHKNYEKILVQKFSLFLRNHWFFLFVIVLFLLATYLRAYNFSDRWGLGNDDARDVAIAKEALRRHEIPLIGSFSSAGPFVFGPFFYWFIMGSYLLLPFAFTAPWIMMVIVGLLTIVILMLVAYQLEGKNFALLVGLIAAFSPQLVIRSLTLGQHSFIAFLTALALFLFILLYRQPRLFMHCYLG